METATDLFMGLDIEHEAARVHEANQKWWHDLVTGERLDRNVGEMCMLKVSELAEAMEGVRKNLQDEHLPEFTSEEVEIADAIIRALDYMAGRNLPFIRDASVVIDPIPENANTGALLLSLVEGVTLIAKIYYMGGPAADEGYFVSAFLAKCFTYAHHRKLRLVQAYNAKMAYNAVRADHQLEHRKGVHGKKW